MNNVATLYVRDVPERLYKSLRARARRNGRSLNAEVLEVLGDVVERTEDAEAITRRLAEIAAEINWPEDAPAPERMIRQDRDNR
jgi:plasmid stability protein